MTDVKMYGRASVEKLEEKTRERNRRSWATDEDGRLAGDVAERNEEVVGRVVFCWKEGEGGRENREVRAARSGASRRLDANAGPSSCGLAWLDSRLIH